MTTAETNPLPIAAIAGYFGAKCSYEHVNLFDDGWSSYEKFINGDLITQLEVAGFIRNFKLHLRPLSSLTDEEIREMARLAGIEAEESDVIQRTERAIIIQDGDWKFMITYNGYISTECADLIIEGNPAPLIDYCKSIGVFWPGSIDEQYVEVITT